MVAGSITRARDQSIRGRSSRGWRLGALKAKLDMAPPTIVMLDSAIAIGVVKPA